MRDRRRWALVIALAAALWLVAVLWLSLAHFTRGFDPLVLAMSLLMQLVVLIAWWLIPRLPLWLVAGHGLIMLSLGLGLVITAPGPSTALEPGVGPPLPWFLLGTLPAGLAMVVAAAVAWTPQKDLLH